MSRHLALLLLFGITAPQPAVPVTGSSGAIASIPRTPGLAAPARSDTAALRGIAAGVTAWPPTMYCAGPMTGTAQALDPVNVLAGIQHAAECGVRLVLVTPRKLLTTTGRVKGGFLLDRAKALTDDYAAELPPDTLGKYRETLLGLTLADDYGCRKCWGGEPISQQEIEEWAAYTRAKLPGLPLGVRVPPRWVAEDPKLAPLLDYAWAQYQTRKGDPQKYYDDAARDARRLGLKLVTGLSVQNCYGVGSEACRPDDLLRFGTAAVTHPASCAFINWKYDPETWDDPQIQATWAKLLALAKARPTTDCRRAGD